jgi:signal transduction histidine kinase
MRQAGMRDTKRIWGDSSLTGITILKKGDLGQASAEPEDDMKRKASTARRGIRERLHAFRWTGLQARMTMSYVWATIGLVLLFVAMAWLAFVMVATTFVAPFVYTLSARELAERYALAAALEANPSGLNPHATFLPHHPGSLSLPGTPSDQQDIQIPYLANGQPDKRHLAFALLVTPQSRVLASSYPAQYPAGASIALLLPERTRLITNALAGTAASGSDRGGVYAVEPVWSRQRQPIGAVYVQLPGAPSALDLLGQRNWLSVIPALLMISLLLLIVITPIGGLFGLLTTRGIVRRIRRLATATTQVAAGKYTQRIPLSRQDEIGDLERHFNSMARQLEESREAQHKLTEQNARLAERERISRELHDAISQELFSLRMLAGGLESAIANGADLHPYLETLEQATDGMLRDLRALLLELRPVQLENLELSQALEDLALTYRTRLGTNVHAEIEPVSLPEQAQQELFRMAQEALTNAIRHGEATALTLVLRTTPEQVELVISDNGKGFEQAEGKAGHGLGLSLMQERAEQLGGRFSIESMPGAGTRIAISISRENQS